MFTPMGAIPALVTPLDPDGELLEDALRHVLDHVVDNGVHGVFVLGSSGEIYGLSDAQKRRVVEITVEHVAGRVPVYAGASEITTRDCIATARMVAAVGGVSALSVLTPYFMTPTQSELITHYTRIAESTDLPVILYTNPGRTQVDLDVETVLTLAEVPGIIGLKDSSGNLDAAFSLRRDDEIGILADSLRKMTSWMKNSLAESKKLAEESAKACQASDDAREIIEETIENDKERRLQVERLAEELDTKRGAR